jgi:hypothetical protein
MHYEFNLVSLRASASFDKDGEDPPGVSTGILSLYHGARRSVRAYA